MNAEAHDAQRRASGLALALAGAAAFSGKAIIVKLAYRHGVDAITLLMYRMLFALPVFLVMAWWGGRGKPGLTRSDVLGVLGLGFSGYYLASYLDFMGLAYVSASLERLILYLNPTLVLILGLVLYGRPIRRIQALAMAVSYAGIAVVFGHEIELTGPHTTGGALLIFLSAVSYAVYLVYSGQLVKRLGSLRLVGLASAVASLCCLLQFLAMRPVAAALVAAPVLWLSLLNAIVCTVLPVMMVMMAVERVGPAIAAQAGMVGPLVTLMLGVWLLGEPLTLWVLIGTALVLTGVFMVGRWSRP